MKELLNYDQKTGIYGSTAFSNSLSRTIDRGSLDNLALAFLDIDDFKYVNDTYGHTAGDEVLMCLAAMIKRNLWQGSASRTIWRRRICHTVYRGKLGILLLFVGTDSKRNFSSRHMVFQNKKLPSVSVWPCCGRDGTPRRFCRRQTKPCINRRKTARTRLRFLNRRKVANPLNSQNWGTYFRGVDKGLSTAIY